MQSIKKNMPGIAVCLVIAIPAWLLGKLVPVIGLNSNVVKLIKSGVKGLPN